MSRWRIVCFRFFDLLLLYPNYESVIVWFVQWDSRIAVVLTLQRKTSHERSSFLIRRVEIILQWYSGLEIQMNAGLYPWNDGLRTTKSSKCRTSHFQYCRLSMFLEKEEYQYLCICIRYLTSFVMQGYSQFLRSMLGDMIFLFLFYFIQVPLYNMQQFTRTERKYDGFELLFNLFVDRVLIINVF